MRNGKKKMKRLTAILLSLLLLCGCGSSRPDQETGWEEAPQWKEGLPAQAQDQTPDSAPERVPQDLSQLDTTQYSGAFGSFATLTDPTSGVPVLDAVVPYGWSAWVETDWQVYSTLNPCIAYVFFQSPDGQATVMFQTAHNYLQMYDTLGWFPHTDYNDTETYISHLAYKDAGEVLDLYFNGLLGTGGTVTGEEEVPSQLLEALDQAAEQALANTVNGLNSYGQNATALNYGGTAAIRRYRYTDGNGQTAVAQAIASDLFIYYSVPTAYGGSYECIEWEVPLTVVFSAPNQAVLDQYQAQFEMILENSSLRNEFNYLKQAYGSYIQNLVMQSLTSRIDAMTQAQAQSFLNSYDEGAYTSDDWANDWSDYIYDRNEYTTTDGSTIKVGTEYDTVYQNGSDFYFGSAGSAPFGWEQLTPN